MWTRAAAVLALVGQGYIYVFISIFMVYLSLLSIAKGIYRGSYLGGCIAILGLPLLAVGISAFVYGFLNFSFP